MASFTYLALTVLEICSVKVEKTGDLFRKTTDFRFLSFQNWFLSNYFPISPEPLDPISVTPFWKANLNIHMLRK